MVRYIPTALTLARFPLGIAFAYCYFYDLTYAALVFASLGCITDYLDGYLARRWNVCTKFGKIMDAYGDKWMCWIMTIVAFDIVGPHVTLIALTIIILAYDLGLSFLRYILGHRHITVSWYAKWKTTLLMLGLLIIYVDWTLGYPGQGLMTLGALWFVLPSAAVVALLSIGRYLREYQLEWLIPYPVRLIF